MLPAIADWRTESHSACLAASANRFTCIRHFPGNFTQTIASVLRGPCEPAGGVPERLGRHLDDAVARGDEHPFAVALLDRSDAAGVGQDRSRLHDPKPGIVLDHGAAVGDVD